MMKLNSTCWAKAAILGALFSAACSNTDASNGTDAGNGTGGTGGTGTGGTAATGGGAGTAAGGSSTGDGGASNGGTGGSAGSDSDASGSGGTGGANGPIGRGLITITQTTSPDDYSISATFVRYSNLVQTGTSNAICTVTGACTACVYPTDNSDAGDVPTPTATILDAGAITITGAGTSKATLTFGLIPQSGGRSGYAEVTKTARFFSGGDSVSVTGAGGPDLGAFTAETVIAPNDITLTAPACPLVGCAIDRTKDLPVTWTGGGAGKIQATYETVGADKVAIVICNFDAASGAATIPHALLEQLGNAGDATTTGVATFLTTNGKDFTVGDIPTHFGLDVGLGELIFTASK